MGKRKVSNTRWGTKKPAMIGDRDSLKRHQEAVERKKMYKLETFTEKFSGKRDGVYWWKGQMVVISNRGKKMSAIPFSDTERMQIQMGTPASEILRGRIDAEKRFLKKTQYAERAAKKQALLHP